LLLLTRRYHTERGALPDQPAPLTTELFVNGRRMDTEFSVMVDGFDAFAMLVTSIAIPPFALPG
jgi:hypothetical protein